MEREHEIPGLIRKRLDEIVADWRRNRSGVADDEAFARLEAGMGRLVEVFAEFLMSPDSVETFSRGGVIHALVGEIARDQHVLGRDAAGVIEDFSALRRALWQAVEAGVDLSSRDGGEVADFFVKLMQASDWATESALEAYDSVARREMEEALGRAAATDLVTGLPDQDAFSRLLLPNAIETQERFALAVFDVAGFSETVASGEVKRARKVLRRLTEAVRSAAGEHAACARFGDDEVCVLLPGQGSESAYEVAERVLDRLGGKRKDDFEVDVGIAEYPAHGEEAEAIIVEMLRALKMAKRVGGGGIVVAQ